MDYKKILAFIASAIFLIAAIATILQLWAQLDATQRQVGQMAQEQVYQSVQLAAAKTQIALSADQNRILKDLATKAAEQLDLQKQLQTPRPSQSQYAPTATAISESLAQIQLSFTSLPNDRS